MESSNIDALGTLVANGVLTQDEATAIAEKSETQSEDAAPKYLLIINGNVITEGVTSKDDLRGILSSDAVQQSEVGVYKLLSEEKTINIITGD